ncbi:MAG: 50S ribosomal protein L29 [Candidatus Babeliales bacterium]
MKIRDIKKELKNLNAYDLMVKEVTFRQELFNHNLTVATGHVKDYSQFKKLRKNIARAMTYRHQKGT